MKVLKAFINILRHHKDVQKEEFKLIFTLLQRSEMYETRSVNRQKKVSEYTITFSLRFS